MPFGVYLEGLDLEFDLRMGELILAERIAFMFYGQ